MKYSGVEWIGEIPDFWKIKPVRECLFERNEKNDKLEENTILSLSAKEGVTLYDGENHSGNKPREDLSGYKIVKENDIVANSMNILSGSVGLSKYNGVVSPVYYIYHIRDSKDNIRFFSYIFQCNEFQKNLRRLGKGILIRETEDGKLNTIRTKVPAYQLSIEKLPYPNGKIQQMIVDILDKKTFEIDSLIEIENQQIEKLKEYKQAVITETVTKGLDKNAPLKDSGIDWIGKIPEGTSVMPLKFLLAEPMMYGANESGLREKISNGYRYIRITDIDGDGNLKNNDENQYLSHDKGEPYSLSEGDVLFGRSGGTVGKTFIYHDLYGKSAFAGYLIKGKCDLNKLLPEYLYLYTQSSIYELWKQQIFIQSTIQNIGANKYSMLPIIVGSVEWQNRVISYIQIKSREIDELIIIKQKKINQLVEYKKSLIYEYVTGKKEVC